MRDRKLARVCVCVCARKAKSVRRLVALHCGNYKCAQSLTDVRKSAC